MGFKDQILFLPRTTWKFNNLHFYSASIQRVCVCVFRRCLCSFRREPSWRNTDEMEGFARDSIFHGRREARILDRCAVGKR